MLCRLKKSSSKAVLWLWWDPKKERSDRHLWAVICRGVVRVCRVGRKYTQVSVKLEEKKQNRKKRRIIVYQMRNGIGIMNLM